MPDGPGAAARELLQHARELRAAAEQIGGAVARSETAALETVREARRYRAECELEHMPLDRLRELTTGNVRWSALQRAGYRTVAQVVAAPRHRLQHLPGVGEQSAIRVKAAAKQVADTLTQRIRVRPDPDKRSPYDTKVLAAVRQLEAVRRHTAAVERHVADVARRVPTLLDAADPASSRRRMRPRLRST